jgi:hypothetical protein
VAAVHADAELADAARVVQSQVAARDPAPGALALGVVVDRLASAAGLSAVGAAVAASVRGGATRAPRLGDVHADGVGLARASWLSSVTQGLPSRWSADLRDRVATTAELRLAVTDALAHVPLAVRRSRAADTLLGLAAVVAVGAIVLAGLLVADAAGTAVPWAPTGVVVAAAVAGAVVLLVLSTLVRRRAAATRGARVVAEGRAALESVARVRLLAPTQDVLAEHRQARELAQRALGTD